MTIEFETQGKKLLKDIGISGEKSMRSWPKYWLGLFALAGLAIWFVISDLSSRSDAIESEAANHTQFYSKSAEDYAARRCVTVPPTDQMDCINKAQQVARENQRIEQDLAAQKVTAWWTKVMGIAALIGMALSATGVLLVWTTFAETRKANDISGKFQRAWLKVTLKVIDHDGPFGYQVGIEVENTGSSVATHVVVRFSTFNSPPGSPMVTGIDSHQHTIRQGDKTIVSVTMPTIDGFDGLWFAGYAAYNTVFGGPHYCYFCLRLTPVPNRPGISGPSRAGVPEIPVHWPADT